MRHLEMGNIVIFWWLPIYHSIHLILFDDWVRRHDFMAIRRTFGDTIRLQ